MQPSSDDAFEMQIPGYDLRRILLAEDPLAAANAFFVQIRTVFATVLGLRMCPFCPRCACPCQDAVGSVAELMGVLNWVRRRYVWCRRMPKNYMVFALSFLSVCATLASICAHEGHQLL